jgi:hypothetical protein
LHYQKAFYGFFQSARSEAFLPDRRRRTGIYPDEIERWPVKMKADFDPVALKRSFHQLAMTILAEN